MNCSAKSPPARPNWSHSAGWMAVRAASTPEEVTSPADLKGVKLRMMGNPLFVDTMNAMGGNGISMAYGEVFSALQRV